MNPARRCRFAMALWLATAAALADGLDTWTKIPSGVGLNLYGVAHGAGQFVAVGQSGGILVSSNGNDWAGAVSGVASNLFGVTHADGVFVAVGQDGLICRSTNGLDWAVQPSPTTNTLNGVAFGNGCFVATGNAGTLLTSPDGVNWTPQTSGTPRNLVGAAWGNGRFMAVGRGSSNPGTVLTSDDGVAWVDRTYPQLGVGFYAVAQGAGTFVAMDARGVAYTSATGTNWTSRGTGNGDYVFGLTFAQGLFVGAGGPYGGGGQKITTSPDGIAWQLRPVNVTNSAALRAVTYGNGCFLAVGDKGMILKSGPVCTLRPPAVTNGSVTLWLEGEAGRRYRIQASTNPASGWEDWLTITNTGELMPFTDPIATGTMRLYRAVTE